MTQLMLCQIGPVQAFIAAGRRTADLAVGSKLLSRLASAGIDAALQTGADLIFPHPGAEEDEAASVPHRFAFLTEYTPDSVARHIQEAVLASWHEVSDAVRTFLYRRIGRDGDWLAAFDRSRDSWLEFYWVAVAYERAAHGEAVRSANRAMAARKQIRHFPQIEERGWKCTLTGASSALPIPPATASSSYREMRNAWNKFSAGFDEDGKMVRPSEMLGGLALTKRLAATAMVRGIALDIERFPSTRHIAGIGEGVESDGREVEAYFAVLHMDGDHMGTFLSKLNDPDQHKAISRELAHFARHKVPSIVRQFDRNPAYTADGAARLVYAGGDDVLALLPVRAALPCAEAIRTAFATMIQQLYRDYGGDSVFGDLPTISAGIAIVPENYPLDLALDLARSAEGKAKQDYGRNAVCVIEAAGSSLTRTMGAKWSIDGEYQIVDMLETFIGHFRGDRRALSGKLGYDLQETLVYALTANGMDGARSDEVRRLVARRASEYLDATQRKALVETLSPLLVRWGEAIGWQALTDWLILARFLASDGKVRR